MFCLHFYKGDNFRDFLCAFMEFIPSKIGSNLNTYLVRICTKRISELTVIQRTGKLKIEDLFLLKLYPSTRNSSQYNSIQKLPILVVVIVVLLFYVQGKQL